MLTCARINDVIAFLRMFEVFEIIRRWAWIYFRVEWECVNKNIDGHAEQSSGSASTAAPIEPVGANSPSVNTV